MIPRTKYTGYTEVQARAFKKYRTEKLDTITVRYPKGTKDKLTAHLELTGESLAAFMRRAIDETIKRDREAIRERMKNGTLTENAQTPEE